MCFDLKCLRYVSVEPTYFVFCVATDMIDFLRTNLYLQKACRPLARSEPDLDTECVDEKRGQEFMAEIFNTAAMVSGWTSMLTCLLVIAYSDSIGRKRRPFLVVSLCGFWLQSVSEMTQTYFWDWPASPGAIVGCFLPDVVGGWFTVSAFCVLLIYEKSSLASRHVVLTGVICLQTSAKLVARGVVGRLLKGVGFFYSFAVCVLLYTMSLVCTLGFVREDKPDTGERGMNLRQLFEFKKVFDSVKVIMFSKKPLKHRITIWLLQTLTVLVYFNLIGEQSVFYLYFRYRYHWDERKFSDYSAYRTVIGVVGSILYTLIMSKLLKIHDAVIGAFAAFMDTLAALGYFFAVQDWQIYSVPFLDMLHGVALATCYSLVSKFFTEEDFGRLNSVQTLFSLAVGFSYPAYSFLFRNTMDTLPNAFFLLSVFLNIMICIIYSATYFLCQDIR